MTDVDLHGHVNNAAYWQAVEDRLARRTEGGAGRMRARLEYRRPIDVDDTLELVESTDGAFMTLGFAVGTDHRAIARVEPLDA